jgi:hypothetical protein
MQIGVETGVDKIMGDMEADMCPAMRCHHQSLVYQQDGKRL